MDTKTRPRRRRMPYDAGTRRQNVSLPRQTWELISLLAVALNWTESRVVHTLLDRVVNDPAFSAARFISDARADELREHHVSTA